MATYPPNQTTPAKGSGNYLWNWLGSSLKKFAQALSPYMTGGDGYSYTEVIISSAELLNPGVVPVGLGTGKELLPPCAPNQYYKVNFSMEFLPGTVTYTAAPNMTINPITILIYTNAITSNDYWVYDYINSYSYEVYALQGGQGLYLNWQPGDFTDGDGTMKVKIWYKVVNFG